MDRANVASRYDADCNRVAAGQGTAPKSPGKRHRAGKTGGKLHLQSLACLDGRTLAARHARSVIAAIENDLGGSDQLSEKQHRLAQRAGVLDAMIESNEAQWLSGKPIDDNVYLARINSQRRIFSLLGLERRSRDVTPTLSDYLMQSAEDQADVEIEEADNRSP
jgi:hypothetical protein